MLYLLKTTGGCYNKSAIPGASSTRLWTTKYWLTSLVDNGLRVDKTDQKKDKVDKVDKKLIKSW